MEEDIISTIANQKTNICVKICHSKSLKVEGRCKSVNAGRLGRREGGGKEDSAGNFAKAAKGKLNHSNERTNERTMYSVE